MQAHRAPAPPRGAEGEAGDAAQRLIPSVASALSSVHRMLHSLISPLCPGLRDLREIGVLTLEDDLLEARL
mgnify:CR=1 FL=1